MRRTVTLALSTLSLALSTVLAGSAARATAIDVAQASYRVDRMGEPMSESAARHELAFRPFAPPRQILAAALLPPFHGADERTNRGIAFEYVGLRDRRYVLAQWPRNGGSIEMFVRLEPGDAACTSARTFVRGTNPSGIVWSTPHGLIMTLQPDGSNDAPTMVAEWQRLVRRGACR